MTKDGLYARDFAHRARDAMRDLRSVVRDMLDDPTSEEGQALLDRVERLAFEVEDLSNELDPYEEIPF